jgi:DNA polymerase
MKWSKQRASSAKTSAKKSWHGYGDYCKNDVKLTWDLFGHMSQGFPKIELRLIDLTVRMFTEPMLQLYKALLELHLTNEKSRKAELLGKFDKDTLR